MQLCLKKKEEEYNSSERSLSLSKNRHDIFSDTSCVFFPLIIIPPFFFDIAAHHCSIFTSICVIINQITHQLPEPAKKFSL